IGGQAGKSKTALTEVAARVIALLAEIQQKLYQQARVAMEANTHQLDSYADLQARMQGEGGGGFADIYWCGRAECETKIREETRATCRAIPLNQNHPAGKCIVCAES